MDAVRVLHLVDPGAPGGGACTLRLVAESMERIASIEQSLLVIGTGTHRRLAERCGAPPVGHVVPPAGATILAHSSVQRAVETLEARFGPFDVVHAWTATSAALAAAIGGERHLVATLPLGPLDGLGSEAFGVAMQQRPMPLLALGSTVRHEYAVAGVDPELLLVLPPGVNADHVARDARERVRARWGIGPSTFALGLLGEPVRWSDAKAAASVLALVALGGHDLVVVVHPDAERRSDAQRYAAAMGLGDRMILDDALAEPWRELAGLDGGLLLSDETTVDRPRPLGSPLGVLLGGGRATRPMTGTLSLLWAAAAGVPVVSESTLAASSIIEEGVSGFLVEQRNVYQAANRVIRLIEDRQMAARVGAAAAAHVRRHHGVSAFCVRLRTVYERLVAHRPMLILGDPRRTVIEVGPASPDVTSIDPVALELRRG